MMIRNRRQNVAPGSRSAGPAESRARGAPASRAGWSAAASAAFGFHPWPARHWQSRRRSDVTAGPPSVRMRDVGLNTIPSGDGDGGANKVPDRPPYFRFAFANPYNLSLLFGSLAVAGM